MEGNQKIHIELPDYIREAAREAARTVIDEHVDKCRVAAKVNTLDSRIAILERRFYLLVGAILGSGVLGGAVGGAIMRM